MIPGRSGRAGSAGQLGGSAFQVSYVVGQLSGILIAIIMLRTTSFGRLPIHPDHRQRRRLRLLPAEGRPGRLGVFRRGAMGVVHRHHPQLLKPRTKQGRNNRPRSRGRPVGQPAVPAAHGDRPGSGTSPWRAQDGCSRMPVRPWPSRSLLVMPTPLSQVSNSRFSLPWRR
jgi:hypothetical protein